MSEELPTLAAMTEDPFALAQQAAKYLRQFVPSIDIALVLGSGWSAGATQLGEVLHELDLDTIPGFAKPVVSGHGGKLLIVKTAKDKIAAVFTGRTHFYEGRGVAPVVHGVRTASAWGAKVLVLTNGCGGLRAEWAPGTVVLIRDHINFTGATALVGANFVDMSEAYSVRLRTIAHQVDPALPEGVYMQFAGPQYETPAEVKMAAVLGADLVGMSTTLETLAAREAGLEVLGLSLVTNQAAGLSGENLDHGEVLQAGKEAAPKLAGLLADLVAAL